MSNEKKHLGNYDKRVSGSLLTNQDFPWNVTTEGFDYGSGGGFFHYFFEIVQPPKKGGRSCRNDLF